MKKPDSPPAPKSGAVLVKETLIAMAKDNVPGTPANYKRYYESLAGGKVPEDTAATALQKLLDSLKKQGSPLVTAWENAVDAAMTRKDPRALEDLIVKSIRAASAAKGGGTDLGAAGGEGMRKAPEDGAAKTLQKLLDSLELHGSPLVTVWENAVRAALTRKDPSALEELIVKSIRATGAAKSAGAASGDDKSAAGTKVLDESYASVFHTLQSRLKVQTSPLVAEWENAVDAVMAQRDTHMLEALILKSVHTPHVEAVKSEAPSPEISPDKCKTCVDVRALNGVLYVMESFAKNMDGVFSENPVLMGQLEIVRDVLENPKNMEKMYGAKRALSKMSAPEKIQAQLGLAKASANSMTEAFLTQIGQTGDDAGAFLREVEAGKKAIEEAKDQAALLVASQALLSGTSAVHGKMKESQAKLESARAEAQRTAEQIRSLEKEVKQAGDKAKQDYLTGLLNKRGMDEQIARMFDEGWEKLTLALLDIDNFKRINEQLGQEAGEKALMQLSDAIKESVGAKGISARMEDEEFVIAFAGYDGAQVKDEMEKLQRLLTRQIFMADGENRVVTFSAGVAQRVEDEAPSETLSRADDAMYSAKRKGKNRVEIAGYY